MRCQLMIGMTEYEKKRVKKIALYSKRLKAIYTDAANEAASIGASITNFDPNKKFTFSRYPKTKARVDKLFKQIHADIKENIINSTETGWSIANQANDYLVNSYYGANVKNFSDNLKKKYFGPNTEALKAFKKRQISGLKLSDRVWNYTNRYKKEIEYGLGLGLQNGDSAAVIARDLKKYLKDPDRLFRRVRDDEGLLHLSKNAANYHPGAGRYRSSFRNALRTTRTENNIAYRTADHLRMQKLDFIVGYEVHLSGNHPVYDLCDPLAGKYPKTFKFTGWHPACFCYVTTILKNQKEREEDNERILSGKTPTNRSVNKINKMPQGYNKWIKDNTERINNAKSQPYFIKDNYKYGNIESGLKSSIEK